MKRDFFIQKSRGLKGGPNHVQTSIYGYHKDSPDRFNPVNHIPTGRISMQGVPHPVMGIDNMGNQQYMMPGGEYQFPGSMVTEYPMKQEGGAMTGMMKGTIAREAHFGNNPAIQRMVSGTDQPYDFGNGDVGTHYMASMDNYAVPQIQDQNGTLALGNFGPESNEAIRFNTPEEADYFAKHYKEVAPAFKKEGGWIKGAVKRPGAFTAKANAAGMGVQEYANYVTREGSQASTLTKRQANLAKTFKNMAKKQSKKQFGGASKAPQNVTTDGMVQYNNNIMKNAMARNNFEAMAAQEAEALAQQMAGQMMPPMMAMGGVPPGYHMMPNGQLMPGASHMQMGGNFGYKPNQNINQWADAYSDLKQNNKAAFKDMLGSSGELAGAIYSNTDRNDLELKRLKTKFTDKAAKKEYKQYAKGMNQSDPSTDQWDMYNQNIMNMKQNNQPINMNQMGAMPGNMGMFPYGGQPIPMMQYGGLPMPFYGYGGYHMPAYQPGGSYTNATAGAPNILKINPSNYLNKYELPAYEPRMIPGLNTSDPTGGIGASMHQSGLQEYTSPYTFQGWAPRATAYEMQKAEEEQWLNENRPATVATDAAIEAADNADPTAGGTKTTKTKGTGSGSGSGSGTAEEIKDFTSAADVVTDATADDAGAADNGERRGNVTDEPSSTTTQPGQGGQGQPGQGFFVTQPGAYNLHPTNRWQRGPGAHVGPAVAYNPADTYLDEYTYKGRMFGKGPRKVKMKFSHHGQPGFPGEGGVTDPQATPETPPANELTPGTPDRTTPGGYTPPVENTSPAYNPENRGTYEGTEAGTSPVGSTHGMMDKIEDINSEVNQYLQDNPQEMTPEQWAAANPEMLNAISGMAYGGYIPAMMYGGPIEAFPQAQMYPTYYRQHGGGIPFPEAFPQAQMYPTHPIMQQGGPIQPDANGRQTLVFQGGGQNPVGTPTTEGPWGETYGVWGRKGPDGATMMAAADAGLAGMAGLTALANQGQMRAFEDQMMQKTLGDSNFMANTQSDRGKWTANQGYVDPANMVPTQFQGMNTGAIGSNQRVQMGGNIDPQGGIGQAMQGYRPATAIPGLNQADSQGGIGQAMPMYNPTTQGQVALPTPDRTTPGGIGAAMQASGYQPARAIPGLSQADPNGPLSQYRDGGEYNMSQAQIDQILAMGGTVEYLD